MRTRSRESNGGGKTAKDEELVSLPIRPSRSSKKRRAPDTGATPPSSEETETKRAKGLGAAAIPVAPATPPSKAKKDEVASVEKPESVSRRRESNQGAALVAKAIEDQSLGQRTDEAKKAPVGGVGVAPKGRASLQRTTATDTLSTSWAKKLEIKAKRQAIMAMEKEMRDAKLQEIEQKKQERLEREKRRQQNEMKNTTYQTISKTHKMKTMSKKQLRQIKKRQINSRTGEIEFVSPWGGGKKK